jgi:hypothetical protein
MIAHYRVGVHSDCEDAAKLQNTRLNPSLAVFERAPGQWVLTTKKCPSNAA